MKIRGSEKICIIGENGVGKSVIEINHLTRDYGGEKGIFDVSVQVNCGKGSRCI